MLPSIHHNLITHPTTSNRLRNRVPLSKRMYSLASDTNGTTSPKSWANTTWRRLWKNLNYQLWQYIAATLMGIIKPSLFWIWSICQLHASNRTKRQPKLYMWWNSDSSVCMDLPNDRCSRWYQNCWWRFPNEASWLIML